MSTKKTRRELLLAVADHVRRTGDTTLPWDDVPGLAEEFGSAEAVLRELHRRWYARFFARLDAWLEGAPDDPARAVEEVWEQVTAEDPARRALLDAYGAHPALRVAEERQRRLLAWRPAASRRPSRRRSRWPRPRRPSVRIATAGRRGPEPAPPAPDAAGDPAPGGARHEDQLGRLPVAAAPSRSRAIT